jgi:uncharacterized protein Yka (UPF0111/DUF47 family)
MRLFGIGLLPASNDYTASLVEMTLLIGEGAQSLAALFKEPNGKRDSYISHIAATKRSCDQIRAGISLSLSQTFITAIDREDIHALASSLGQLITVMEELAQAVVTNGIQEYQPQMLSFTDLIQRMTAELALIVPTINHPHTMKSQILEFKRLRSEGKDLYHCGLSELFRGASNAQEIIAGKDLYENFGATLNSCHSVGRLVELIKFKNA